MEVRRRTITTERAGMGTFVGRIIPYCCAHTETSGSSFRAVRCAPEQRVTHRRKVSFFWKVNPPPGDARPGRKPGANGIGRLLKNLEFFLGKKGKFRKVVNHFALRSGKGWPERNPALRGNSFGVGHGPDTKTPDGVFDPLPRAPPGLAKGGPLEPRYTYLPKRRKDGINHEK